MQQVHEIRMGTMGWAYEDWRDVFYSRQCPTGRLLEEYSTVFDTIELDSTFYGAPRKSTITGWAAQVPARFLFSAKVPRAVTHERRLVGAAEAAVSFGDLMHQGLGKHLGALLLQLPPEFAAEDRATLETFVQEVTSSRLVGTALPWVVEFRNASWKDTDIVAWLAAQGVMTATSERLDLDAPLRYVRLLGTENSVARFDAKQFDHKEELDTWATRLQTAEGRVFFFVRNFYEGHAPETLFSLQRRLHLPVHLPPGQQQMALF